MCKCMCGYVSVSVEEYSCLECVHTCSHVNEAERLELSCESGSCQHCGVCDVWAHPSLRDPFLRRGWNSNPRSFPIPHSASSYLKICFFLLFLVEFNLHFFLFFLSLCLYVYRDEWDWVNIGSFFSGFLHVWVYYDANVCRWATQVRKHGHAIPRLNWKTHYFRSIFKAIWIIDDVADVSNKYI